MADMHQLAHSQTTISLRILFPFILSWTHRALIVQLIKREVLERYRGSILGLIWSFMHPIIMLLVYLFVFSVVFQIRWGLDRDGEVEFAIVLFSGLVVHAFLAECLVKAPNLIIRNPHFVKKIVFPLEILTIASVGAALFHLGVGLVILILANIVVQGGMSWHIVYLPIVLLPLIVVCLGVSWFIASFSVFVRDVGQIVGILATVLLFLCPIFYPLTAVPEKYQTFMYLNPLTVIVEQVRTILIYEGSPKWVDLGIYFVVAYLSMCFGFWWFNRTRHAFSDAL